MMLLWNDNWQLLDCSNINLFINHTIIFNQFFWLTSNHIKTFWFHAHDNAFSCGIWRVNEHKQPDAPTATPHWYDGHQLSVVWIKSTRMCAFLHFTDHKPGHWSGACIFTWSVLEANTWNSIWNTNYLQSVYYLLWLFGNRNGDFYLK